GFALQQQGKLEEAIKQYQRSLAIDPEYTKARSNLREAERLLAIKLSPSLPDIDDTKFLPNETDEPLVNTLRSTARIIAEVSADGISIGAGWVVKKEANTVWIVTNRHVISDSKTDILSKKIEVEFFSELPDAERPRYSATITNSTDADDYELDLAVLKVTGIPDDIQTLETRSGRVPRDANVRIIGHPYTIENPWSVSRGEVVNYNPNNPQISMSGLFAQGNSGSPVIDSNNQVIGMMVGIRSSFDAVIATDQPNLDIIANQPATGGVGLAYRIDIVIDKLQEWGILD
nr:trypsin-like peptidase domain-containing protein [Xenococcus sp. MO_188.B8]